MPTYVYRRDDGSTFEIQQRITEDALTTCPETGQKVVRVISSNTGLIFKGSGFYLTDYARNGGSKSSSKEASSSSGDSPATETSKPDSTPAKKEAA
jgi:putative FmdB family regulatory protein